MGICRSCVFVAPPRPAPSLVLLGWWEMRKGRGRERRWKDGTVRGVGWFFIFLGYPGFGFFLFWIYGLGVLVVCYRFMFGGPEGL